jgi:hypothetical protein
MVLVLGKSGAALRDETQSLNTTMRRLTLSGLLLNVRML